MLQRGREFSRPRPQRPAICSKQTIRNGGFAAKDCRRTSGTGRCPVAYSPLSLSWRCEPCSAAHVVSRSTPSSRFVRGVAARSLRFRRRRRHPGFGRVSIATYTRWGFSGSRMRAGRCCTGLSRWEYWPVCSITGDSRSAWLRVLQLPVREHALADSDDHRRFCWCALCCAW